jgi:voltage-gated potassium channel Kch
MIAISADDDTVTLATGEPAIDTEAIRAAAVREPAPERTLILGWNHRAPAIIAELDAYVAAGSTLSLVADEPGIETAIASRATELRHQQVTVAHGDTTDRRQLEALAVQTFDHVIVLGSSDRLGAQEADARTLVTLLHLRDIAERSGRSVPIVSEMLDVRNRELAEVTRADDFIVSDRLVSLLLAQVSENREVAGVFADLFSADGAELYLKAASDYVSTGVDVTFYTVVEAARRRGEVAVGYRLKAESGDVDRARGVHLNPPKRERVAFTDADRIIVLAAG